MSSSPPFWNAVLNRLGQEIPGFTVDAWVRCLGVEAGEDRLLLLCPTPFHRERVRERFLSRIGSAVEAETGRALAIDLSVAPRTAAPSPPAT